MNDVGDGKKTHVPCEGGGNNPYTSCADEKAWSQENFRLSLRQISTFGSLFEKLGTFGSLFEKLVTQS